MSDRSCKSCNKTFDISKFYSNGNGYYRHKCKKCENKRVAKYKKNSSKVKERDKKRSEKRVENLTDEYICKLLNIKKRDRNIIDLKKLELTLKREIWKNT